MLNILKRVFYFFILAFLLFACSKQPINKSEIQKTDASKTFKKDLLQIKESGVLRAITTYSPTGYFLYRGQTLGFEYEMLSKFANKIGVRLEMVLANDVDSLIPMLIQGKGNVISTGYTITAERKKQINFVNPYLITHQTLIQKKPTNWRKMGSDRIKKQIITDVVDLIGDTVSVRKETSFYDQLVNLSQTLGDTIYINILPGNLTVEETIKMVNDGLIKYTIADNNIASIHKSHYPDLDVETPVSLSQRIAWGVRKNSPDLLEELNNNIKNYKGSAEYNVIYNKYFKNRRKFNKIISSDYYTETTGKISKYDDLVKKYANQYGWDWRLVKSIIYQESKFDPNIKSWAGAEGLMQIMPLTAKGLGVKDVKDPEQSLRGGLKYLDKLYKNWKSIPDSIQRIKFALASYNCGYGHVIDAKALAKKYKKDTLNWDDGVDEFILKLSKAKYYQDPVVRSGYVRGSEPYNYVKEIFYRYEQYKYFVK